MRARCTGCNAAIKITPRKGVKLSDQTCHCGGKYTRMRIQVIDGESPIPGYTKTLMGRKFYSLYTSGAGKWLYDRNNEEFINVTELLSNPQTNVTC